MVSVSVDAKRLPVVLLDTYDDGYCEERGYVQAIVTEDEARQLLKEFCLDDDGEPYVPDHGPAKRIWLAPDRADAPEHWPPCDPADEDAMEFWEVPVV